MDLEILIIDDKLADAEAVGEILSELANVKPVAIDNPLKAIHMVERNPKRFPLILSDFNLKIKDLDGVALAKKIWQINPQQLIAIFSGESNLDAPIKCIGTPIVEFIKKGAPATVTQKKVQNLLQKYLATNKPYNVSESITENREVCAATGMVSKSTVMADLARAIAKVAISNTATVLIRGASGTGKELVAKAIHNLSGRKNGPFKAINMGAFQSTVIESELFGHEKGAFTGAGQSRRGAFEDANGGTIFLDEIGELPLELQVKLLRVLQEREVQPVGSNKATKVDVRVIAATHVNLEAQIASGRFRFDLFQRLNVIALRIPDLCERSDDIELLASHFLKKYGATKTIHSSALLQLEKYRWPGNVRELENLIQKLIILTEDEVILPRHLPSEIFQDQKEASALAAFDYTINYQDMSSAVQRLEREYYVYHLSKAKSVRDAALNRMNMAPSTLRDKMEFFGITFKGENKQPTDGGSENDQFNQ